MQQLLATATGRKVSPQGQPFSQPDPSAMLIRPYCLSTVYPHPPFMPNPPTHLYTPRCCCSLRCLWSPSISSIDCRNHKMEPFYKKLELIRTFRKDEKQERQPADVAEPQREIIPAVAMTRRIVDLILCTVTRPLETDHLVGWSILRRHTGRRSSTPKEPLAKLSSRPNGAYRRRQLRASSTFRVPAVSSPTPRCPLPRWKRPSWWSR